jgi:predicted alpha/beta superfamily hydrolase
MKKISQLAFVLVILLILKINNSSAQENEIISDSIYSNVLNEYRSVKVILPENYNKDTSKKFEAIYLTDGEWVVNLFPFIYKFAQDEQYVPQVIIVALPNTYLNKTNQRDRDFLPVKVSSPAISGGADKFISFLKDELRPYIDKNYRTCGINSLYGHSYGGLFVMYTLLTEPQLFDTYYSTDPSMWWNNDYVIKMASEKLGTIKSQKVLWIAGIEETYKGMGIGRMDSVLRLKAPDNLKWKIATFPNEKHNSVRLKAMYDGIKYAYQGFTDGPISFHPMGAILLKDKPAPVFILNNIPELRYELDGSEPDLSSPEAESRIILNGPADLVLKTFSTTGKYDQTARASYVLGDVVPSQARPKRVSSGGFKYSIYEGMWDKIPDFKKMKALQTGITDSLFSMKNLQLKKNFALVVDGYVEIAEDGYYLWAIGSNNGSRLYINNKLLIDNDGIHNIESAKSFMIPMQKGFYPLKLEYFQTDENHDLQLIYLAPGASDPTPVPLKYRYHRN